MNVPSLLMRNRGVRNEIRLASSERISLLPPDVENIDAIERNLSSVRIDK